jgi:hypothetical protein
MRKLEPMSSVAKSRVAPFNSASDIGSMRTLEGAIVREEKWLHEGEHRQISNKLPFEEKCHNALISGPLIETCKLQLVLITMTSSRFNCYSKGNFGIVLS